MIVNIHAAKTHLSKLIEAAEAGEDVVIARNGKPAVKLIPVVAAHGGVAEEAAKPLHAAAGAGTPPLGSVR